MCFDYDGSFRFTPDVVEVNRYEEPNSRNYNYETDPDSWPYPTQFVESRVEGELAERVCRAAGVPTGSTVTIIEEKISDGYSEWTQENEFVFSLQVDTQRFEFTSSYTENGLMQFMDWLDENDPKVADSE